MPLGGKEMQRALEADKRKGALSEVNKQYFLKNEKAFEQIVFTTSHKCEKIKLQTSYMLARTKFNRRGNA